MVEVKYKWRGQYLITWGIAIMDQPPKYKTDSYQNQQKNPYQKHIN